MYGEVDSPFVPEETTKVHEMPKPPEPAEIRALKSTYSTITGELQIAWEDYAKMKANLQRPDPKPLVVTTMLTRYSCCNCGEIVDASMVNCRCGYPVERTIKVHGSRYY